MTHGMYYAKELSKDHGELEVNDTNSPNGKRKTQIYTVKTVDIKGNTVLFEFWSEDAKLAELYFR